MKYNTKKTLRFKKTNMRFVVLSFCLIAMQIAVFAQNEKKITIKTNHISVVEALQSIEKQSGLSIAYNESQLKKENNLDLNIEGGTLDQALSQVLQDTQFTYQLENGYIMIVPKQVDVKKKISGHIVDEQGDPVIGVNIREKGSDANGTITDMDGNFSLDVSPNAILRITYVGFSSQDVSAAGKSTLNIILKEDSKILEMVVVTALGIKREVKALSYNVQEIKQEELLRAKDANFINSLNGKVAGVTINSSSSGIGGASKVVMRGSKSIDKSNNALYVIDGVPMLSLSYTQGEGQFDSSGSTEGIADINPEDIESMTVLTGAAAAALYGSAAANGAVLITTKRGQAGKIKVGFSSTFEFGQPFIMPKFQNIYGNDGRIDSWGAKLPHTAEKYDPCDFFETAHNYTNAITVSGGTDKNQSFLSASSTNSQGLVPNNKYNRYNFTFTNTSYLLNDKLKIDASTSFIMQNNRNMVNQGEYMNPLTSAYLLPRGDGLEKTKVFERYNPTRKIYEQLWGDFEGVDGMFSGKYSGDYTLQNPYWVAYRNVREMERERFMLSVSASYILKEWSSSEKWDISSRVRTDHTRYKSSDKRYASTIATLAGSKNGYFGFSEGTEKQTYIDVLTNYTRNMNWDNVGEFQFNINLGASLQDSGVDGSFGQGPIRENGIPNFFNLYQIDQEHNKSLFGQNGWKERTQSIFASMEIGYNNYLYLTLTGRNDWASQLTNSPQSSFFYPSVGLSAILTEMISRDTKEKLYPVLSFLKLKGAYSSVASPFPRELTTPTHKFDEADKVWKEATHMPIGQLYPERTNSLEVGINSKWLNNKLGFDFTFYRTNTYNQTLNIVGSSSSGYDSFYVQTGRVRNWGFESGLGFTVKAGDKFTWDTYATFGYNKNKIVSLMESYIDPTDGQTKSKEFLVKHSFGGVNYILKTGGSVGDIYASADFRRNMDGQIYLDEKNELSIDTYTEENNKKIGSVLPDYNMGWKHNFTYGNVSLGALISGRVGGVVVSMTEAALDHYGVSKASADARENGGVLINGHLVPAQNYYTVRGKNRLPQYYTYSATNFRLQEAYIGYKIPKKVFRDVVDCTVSLVGRNLLMLYSKAPFDPESISSTGNYAQGLDYFMVPSTRAFAFNVKFNF